MLEMLLNVKVSIHRIFRTDLTVLIVEEANINNTDPSIQQIGHHGISSLGTVNFGTENTVPK